MDKINLGGFPNIQPLTIENKKIYSFGTVNKSKKNINDKNIINYKDILKMKK